MNKKEAIQAMLDVKCVYHVKWEQGEFCKINDVGRIIRYERGCFSQIDINSQPEDGWEIYEEPKKKVKMYQWIIQYRKENPRLSVVFYEDFSDASLSQGDYDVIQRADWTEIEVEVK